MAPTHNTPPSSASPASPLSPGANNNSHNEQPQSKRQRIEKIKSPKNCKATATSKSSTSPSVLIESNEKSETNKKSLCSSLSSSANSISTPSSSNNSPTCTPANSRATSLSQLLNVQHIVAASTSTAVNDTHMEDDDISGLIHGSCGSSCGEQSSDEVDRMTATSTIPHLLPTGIDIKSTRPEQQQEQQQQQQLLLPPLLSLSSAGRDECINEMREFEESLTRQCLCGVSERTLRKPFQSHYSQDANGMKRIVNLCEWPTNKLLQFLSNLQLLFDIYLKQNSKGFICARIMDVCDVLIRNDHNLIDEIIVLAGYSNMYVQFLAGRVLASFLVIAKQELNDDWMKKLVDNLFNFERLNHMAVQKIHFSLDIIKRIVKWKDVNLHPLEDEIETETRTNVGAAATAHGLPSTTTSQVHGQDQEHSYMHFQTQQPTLDTNYFAVHYRACERREYEDESSLDADDSSGSHVQSSSRRSAHIASEADEYASNMTSSALIPSLSNFSIENADVNLQSFHEATNQYHQTDMFVNSANITNTTTTTTTTTTITASNSSTTTAAVATTSLIADSGGCHIITLTDSESFDTTHLKFITIKKLENKWPALVNNMSALIASHLEIENAENCILNFLQLWENIISVNANLSIVETLPFYAQLDKFELLLNQNLSCTIYKQMLCLFNEALCYGSTLALQDMLPDETCLLAHQIVRHVKDFRILESLPRRRPENIVSLIGFKQRPIIYDDDMETTSQSFTPQMDDGDAIQMDKTILQKMVLLVLKSIAVTVKEIRSDSSDSSIDSTDYDAFQDMVLIERYIRDVLYKLENFIKNTLEFHPECHFSKILIHLFDDQDDHLIEAMVCTLDVTSGISFRNNAFPELVSMLNPVYTFLEFLKMISNSSDLLLDLLVSNETCFLLYLLRFLKYIRMNWTVFVRSCHEFGMGINTMDDAMSVLIRLRLQISRLVSRQLYPYDISPVLRLLESCESLYEGNELS